MQHTILTIDSLHTAFGARAALHFLAGDSKPVQSLRLARMVWDTLPALFPAFATDLVEGDVRSACWALGAVTADMVGTWDINVEARRIASAFG